MNGIITFHIIVNTMHTATMDVVRLRKALRLMHCLQKERGASCAVVSSGEEFAIAMKLARDATDAASMQLYREMPKSLDRIRKQLDTQTNSTQVHRMLVIYKTLISNVEHEFVRTCLSAAQMPHRNNKTLQSQRSRSTNDFDEYESMEFPQKKDIPSSFMISCSDPNLYYTPQVTRSHKAFTPMTPPTPLAGKEASPTFLEEEYPEQHRSTSLLNLLACLVRLKESTGMQRATISSMMGIESQILVTSLLLEVENQRKLVAELQNLPLFDDSLQTLVRDSVKMSSEMEALQLKIIRDFDLEGFQLKIQSLNVWNMMTVYIDKLYALELLLVEELEFCQEDAGAQVACARTGQNQEDGLVVLEKIFGDKHIAELPPDVVKRKLIEYMGQQDESVPPPPPPSLMSELLLTESSSAPQLASEANKRGESLLSGMLQFPAASVESSKEWQINLDELQFRKRIGRGNAGTTYLAQWSGQTVAAKVAALSEMGLDGWKAEVQTLQRLHHPNVIRLLGSVYNENPLTYCLVLEYCNAGDLSNALQSPTPPDFFNRVATDVANGMAYLHKRGVLHRDIKPSNVLLDGNVQAGVFTSKVSDLGVATSYDEADPNRTAETGTYRWMAPVSLVVSLRNFVGREAY
jgi:hypothetical protein